MIENLQISELKTLRRKSREAALSYLYQDDAQVLPVTQDIVKFMNHFRIERAAIDFANSLILGVKENQKLIDESIEEASENWKLYRMSSVDRSILRLSVWELLFCPETDMPVILDEAIELARNFGSNDSSSFVNGILDQIAKKFRPQLLVSSSIA